MSKATNVYDEDSVQHIDLQKKKAFGELLALKGLHNQAF